MYSEKVMKLFRNPKNMGKMENADAIGEIGNPVCGDMMKVYLKVKNNKVSDIKVETFGCVSAIATSSQMTLMVKGKTLEYAKTLTKKDITDALGGLPPIKVHCSNLAIDALKKAIKNYEEKK